jgi:Cu-Zn family superoxide dismutase
MRTSVIGVVIATVVLIGARADAQTACAELENAEGKIVGTATLEQQGNDIRIVATFTGLPAGTRGFHIHESGKCDPPFESAGGHFNSKRQHGIACGVIHRQ